MSKKYSYNDWWDGKICLSTCVIVTEKNQEKPHVVDWDSIIEPQREEILKKQSELFHNQIENEFEMYKTDFDKKFKNSRIKKRFLEREIKLMKQILFGHLMDYGDIYVTNHRSLSFEKQDLNEIQDYAQRIFINGEDLVVDFIHSPSCKYQYLDRPSNQVRAEIYWKHCLFLQNVKKSIIEPKNPYSEIFKNGYAYNLFVEMKGQFVGDSRKNLGAKYGFIFHNMKYHGDKELKQALKFSVTENIFIAFLVDDLKIDYKFDRLPKSNPDNKQSAYKLLVDKYKALI